MDDIDHCSIQFAEDGLPFLNSCFVKAIASGAEVLLCVSNPSECVPKPVLQIGEEKWEVPSAPVWRKCPDDQLGRITLQER